MWTTLPILCQEFQDVCKFNDRLVSNWGARRNADASQKWVHMVIPTFYPAFIRFQFFKFLQKFIFGSNLLAAGQVDLRMSLQCLELLSPCSWARNAPRSLNPRVQKKSRFCISGISDGWRCSVSGNLPHSIVWEIARQRQADPIDCSWWFVGICRPCASALTSSQSQGSEGHCEARACQGNWIRNFGWLVAWFEEL